MNVERYGLHDKILSMTPLYREYNFDGLPGPTHNYAGLSIGNPASMSHRHEVSHPKQAALQGIAKMRLLLNMGLPQGIIPPQERPHQEALHALGYMGQLNELESIVVKHPKEFYAAMSSSSMWTANAATVTPSLDAGDNILHISTANLNTISHRAFEVHQTESFLRIIFGQSPRIVCHTALMANNEFFDEGAANHMRMAPSHSSPGMEVFVYGKRHGQTRVVQKFPARQSYEASLAIAKTHHLSSTQTFFTQQNPQLIDLGVFHNDVIAMNNENVFIYHEDAYIDSDALLSSLKNFFSHAAADLFIMPIKASELSIADCIESYIFNSQLVTLGDDYMAIIAPKQCESGPVRQMIDYWIATKNPIREVHFVELNQSMRNGGGPACLRLRVLMNPEEAGQVNSAFIMDTNRLSQLEAWVNKYYRDDLYTNDLYDPQFIAEVRSALDELTHVLQIGPIYSFQQ